MKKVKNLLDASIICRMPTSLNIVISNKQNYSSIFSELGESLIACDVRISPCLPVGRAIKQLNESDYIKRFSIKDDFQCTYGKIFVVHYDGKVYPCCSQFIEEEGICLGDANTMSLNEILFKLEHSKLLYAIRNLNLKKFYDSLPKEIRVSCPKEYVNDCDFCAHIIRSKNFEYFKDCVASAFLAK